MKNGDSQDYNRDLILGPQIAEIMSDPATALEKAENTLIERNLAKRPKQFREMEEAEWQEYRDTFKSLSGMGENTFKDFLKKPKHSPVEKHFIAHQMKRVKQPGSG